jgi:hypothetical protein
MVKMKKTMLIACMTLATANAVQAQTGRESLTLGSELSGEAVQAADAGDLAGGRETATKAFETAMSPKAVDGAVSAGGARKDEGRVPLAAQAEPVERVNMVPPSPAAQADAVGKKGKGERIGAVAGKILGVWAVARIAIVGGIYAGAGVSLVASPWIGIPVGIATALGVGFVGYAVGGAIGGWLGRSLD